MGNKLTVCIPFKNEGEEVVKTVKSVRDTAGDRVDIIVLDDVSDDGYDYETNLKPYNVRFYKSEVRQGSSLGKEFCVQHAETPFVFLLDAHSRIYTQDWLDKAIALLESDEAKNTIYCCLCQYFNNDTDHMSDAHMRAYGGYFDYNIKSLFSVAWNLNNFAEDKESPFDIIAILGANYLVRKDYWDYLGGYKGLKLYGREEAFISIKSILTGGNVKCFPGIHTGHKTRPNNKQPYICYAFEVVHNEMVVAYICCPEKFDRLMKCWSSIYRSNGNVFAMAKSLFDSHKDELDELQKEFQSKKVLDYNDLDKLNAKFQKKVGFNYNRLKKANKGTYPKFIKDGLAEPTFAIG